MLNFDRSTVKYGTQNIQSGFLTPLEYTKFVFGRGSAPDSTGEGYSAPPDPLAGLRGGGQGNPNPLLTLHTHTTALTLALTITLACDCQCWGIGQH